MSEPAFRHESTVAERKLVADSLRLELVGLDGDLDISDAELDALEHLLGADLHQFLQ